MMLLQFRRLIDDFCALTQLDDPDAIVEGCALCVDDVECALVHLDHITPDVVYCYVDFGLPPQERCAKVYGELLEANYVQLASNHVAFTVSPIPGMSFSSAS